MKELFLLSIIVFLAACNSNLEEQVKDNREASIDSAKVDFYSAAFVNGKQLMKNHCRQCHAARRQGVKDGDWAFVNIFDRLPQPSEEYFKKFISDSRKLRGEGDPYAIHIDYPDVDYEHEFGKVLSEDDIASMIIYIKLDLENGP